MMIDPKMKNGYPVKKYSDEQIEKCKQKIDFIKTDKVVLPQPLSSLITFKPLLNSYSKSVNLPKLYI
jgi:hypothetical protein